MQPHLYYSILGLTIYILFFVFGLDDKYIRTIFVFVNAFYLTSITSICYGLYRRKILFPELKTLHSIVSILGSILAIASMFLLTTKTVVFSLLAWFGMILYGIYLGRQLVKRGT